MDEVAEQHPVTEWIADLKNGDDRAAQQLWDLYAQRVQAVADAKLGTAPRRVEDEEDLTLSVFKSVFLGAADGQFPRMTDRYDLWHLLSAVTSKKAIDRIRWYNREKRGGGRVRGDSVFQFARNTSFNPLGQHCPNQQPPELRLIWAEERERLLASLRDDTLRSIANWRIEGQTCQQIANTLGISVHSVRRKVRLIQMQWSEELDVSSSE